MTPGLFLVVAAAGGLGAAARFLVDGLIRSRARTTFPWATTVINASGSLVLGCATGLVLAGWLPGSLGAVIATGFLGGYTTFSTASYESVQLVRQRRYVLALTQSVGVMALCGALAYVGFHLGSSL